jgi:hypothetical protein
MKDFNIAKYLKENHLGPHAILGAYVDLHALKEDMDAVNALTDKWKNDPSTDPEGDWRKKPYDQAQASAQDWFDEYEEEGRLDDFYGMSVEELIDALELFGEPDAKKVAPILHKMINSEVGVEDLEGWEQADFGATENKELADRFAKVEKTGNPNKDVKVVKIGKVYKVYTKDIEELEEKKMNSGKNSETITLSYYDYPSISDGDQRFAVKTFIKFVKSLGGDAKVIKDKFDDIDFKLTGISPEDVKKAYAKLLKALDKRSFLADPSPFDYLASWTVNPPELDEYNQLGEEEEMELDTKIPYEGPERKVDGFGDEFKQANPVEETDSMDTDDSVNPFPSLMPDEQDKFDRMMGLIDQSVQPRLGQVKSVIDGAREQGYADRTIFTILARHPLVKDSIEALVDDGFEFQDIVDFFATDFSQNEEIAGYDAGIQMEKK